MGFFVKTVQEEKSLKDQISDAIGIFEKTVSDMKAIVDKVSDSIVDKKVQIDLLQKETAELNELKEQSSNVIDNINNIINPVKKDV